MIRSKPAVNQVVGTVTNQDVISCTTKQLFEVLVLIEEVGHKNPQITDRRSIGQVNTPMDSDLVRSHKWWRAGKIDIHRLVVLQHCEIESIVQSFVGRFISTRASQFDDCVGLVAYS